MTVLVFVVLTLSHTFLSGSSGAGIRYLNLHWIVFREDLAQVLTVVRFSTGTLATLIVISLCLTWVLSRVLKILHNKKNDFAWTIFIFVIVIYLLFFACVQNFVFT